MKPAAVGTGVPTAVFDNLNYTYSAGGAPAVVQYYERTLLEHMKPEMVHARDAQKRALPLNNGKRVQFRRFTPFDAITTPLAEGVTPAGQTLVETAFTAMVKPYGGHVELTDEIKSSIKDAAAAFIRAFPMKRALRSRRSR